MMTDFEIVKSFNEAEGAAWSAADVLEEKIVQLVEERDTIQKKIDALYLAQEILFE